MSSSAANENNPVILTRAATELEASLIVGRLRSEGIAAEMSGMLTSAFRAETPGDVQVLVLPRDVERARQVLATLPRQAGDR